MPEPCPDDPMSILLGSMTVIEGLSLQLSPCRVLAYRETVPTGLLGAYLSVGSKARQFQLGLLTDDCGCCQLGHLLAIGPRAATEAAGCRREVLGTLLLRLASAFAARVDSEGLLLGPVLFVEGAVHASPSLTIRAADVAFGCTRALLVLMRNVSASD